MSEQQSPIRNWCAWLERASHRTAREEAQPREEAQLLAGLKASGALESVRADEELDGMLRSASVGSSSQTLADRVMDAWRSEQALLRASQPTVEAEVVADVRPGWGWTAASAGIGAALALASCLLIIWLNRDVPEPNLANRPSRDSASEAAGGALSPTRQRPSPESQATAPTPRPQEPPAAPRDSRGLLMPGNEGQQDLGPSSENPPSAIVQRPFEPQQQEATTNDAATGWMLVSSANADHPTWQSPVPQGRALTQRTFRLLKGAATLVWPNVGELTIHAPAEFRTERERLFLQRGELMARVLAPTRIDTPGSRLEIIDRASIVADEFGTALRATGPVGMSAANRSRTTVEPGEFRWISNKGEVNDWLVTMLEAEGAMVLAINDRLCAVNQITARQPGALVTATLTQMAKRGMLDSDNRGTLLVNGVAYNFRGMRGIRQVGLRVNDQSLQRFRAAKAKGNEFFVNGVPLEPSVLVGKADGDILGGVGPVAHDVAGRLFDQQLRMINSMSRKFSVDLTSVRRAVEQARAAAGGP